MSASTSETIQTAMGAIMVGVGTLGVLTPARFVQSSGTNQPVSQYQYLTRMWALRETAIGAILLGVRRPDQRRRVLAATIALSVAESVVSLRSSALTGPNGIGVAAAAAGFGAASAYALRRA